ncbi:MAG: helix-turn-helix domain-containing protein, partial [Janthinobacterium sp.]
MSDPGLSDTLPTDTESDDAAQELSCCGKPAGRPRAADMEARMDNLLHTAGCLFLEKGYGKVSLEMIAREAHVAVRTIYVKFGGKSGLFNAVVELRRAAYFSTMPALET